MPEREWALAGFGDRFLADLCDGLIVLGLVALAHYGVDRALLGSPHGLFDEDSGLSVAEAVSWFWFLWNFTYLVGKTGQSWGRRLIGLRVVGTDGLPIGFWRALGRNLFATFISGILYLGFLWVIWDDRKQAWHDKVFRTYVVLKAP